jgi:heme-degrading monooxygenase HmoA
MITELAFLFVKDKQGDLFEIAFAKASEIISKMKGYMTHELQRCVEEENKYVLIVRWNKIEDHTIGFRNSDEYQHWKNLLHHFYEPFPVVEHYTKIF